MKPPPNAHVGASHRCCWSSREAPHRGISGTRLPETPKASCGKWRAFWFSWNSVWSSWWFQILFIFTPKIGEDEPILTHIFQMGWNHQPVMDPWLRMILMHFQQSCGKNYIINHNYMYLLPCDFVSVFSGFECEMLSCHRLTWCRFVHFLGWESLRAGERIIAVDKAPELPDSIRNLVMHAAWWKGGGPRRDAAHKAVTVSRCYIKWWWFGTGNYHDISIGYYCVCSMSRILYTKRNTWR